MPSHVDDSSVVASLLSSSDTNYSCNNDNTNNCFSASSLYHQTIKSIENGYPKPSHQPLKKREQRTYLPVAGLGHGRLDDRHIQILPPKKNNKKKGQKKIKNMVVRKPCHLSRVFEEEEWSGGVVRDLIVAVE